MLKDLQIVGVEVIGEWDEINILCELLLENIKLHSFSKEDFLKSGNVLNLSSNSQYLENDMICNCMRMTYEVIKEKISEGFCELDALSSATGVGTACGGCRTKLLDILNQSAWMHAKIQLQHQYSDDVCSFIIQPLYNHFPSFVPGQYIFLKLQINGYWIERCYTLVSYFKNITHYEIVIKKHSQGAFTPWLFQHKDDHLFGWISYPTGQFTLKEENQKMSLCFAGGIGITPFIAFIQAIKKEYSNHSLHILYTVDNKTHVIIPEEIKHFIATSKTITLEVWERATNGYIDEEVIRRAIENYHPEYIYICGSEKFKSLVLPPLENIDFNREHIFLEEFLPANG